MGGCDWDFWLERIVCRFTATTDSSVLLRWSQSLVRVQWIALKSKLVKRVCNDELPRKSSNTQITWEISNISIYGPKQSHKGVMRVSGRRVELISIGSSVRAELANSSLRSLNWLPEWAFTLKKVTDRYLSIIKWSINLHAMLLLSFKIFRIEVSLLLIFWYVSITFENLYKT
jgi:hypothetical protein